MRRLLPTVVLAAALLMPASALAGKPYVLGNVGNGAFPTVASGPAGVYHVVWNDQAANVFHYCQVLKSKPGCAKSVVLPFNDSTDGVSLDGAPGKAWIVPGATDAILYLVSAQYVSGNTYVWTSVDAGSSFTGPVKVYGGVNGINGTDSDRPLFFPANASIAFPTFNTGLYVNDAKLDGSGASSEVLANLDQTGLGNRSYNLGLAAVANGTVATADDLDNVYTWFASNGADLSLSASWGAPKLVAKGDDSTFAGSLAGQAYVAYTAGTGGHPRFEIRKWSGTAFGKPTVLVKNNGYVADLYVSTGGTPGLVHRENGTGLLFTTSANGGKTFETKPIVVSDELFGNVVVANDDDGSGLAVWPRSGAIAAADLTEVADPSAPAVSKTVTRHGHTLGLNVPGTCVLPGKSYKVSTGGQGIGQLTKVRYTFGAQTDTDTKAPWGVSFKVAKSAKAGATIKVTALASLKTKSSAFTILISSSVDVCGG